jgi:ZIP family zinc transporter
MDGVGIGLAFQVNSTVGFIVAIAVISHDFTDGMNTVSLMLHNQQTAKRSKLFLLFDALAPVVGAASTMFFSVPDHFLILYLGFCAGFLLYIGATDILPEAHNTNSSYRTIGLTIAGVILIFIITRLV